MLRVLLFSSFVPISWINHYGQSIAFEKNLQQEHPSLGNLTTRNGNVYSKSSNVATTWWRGKGRIKNATHPHLGAREWDEQNQPVYQMIVKPSPERLATPKKNFVDTIKPEILCPEGPGIEQAKGKDALLKVRSGIQKYNNRLPGEGEHRKTKSKILCMVYTVDLPELRANLRAEAETWGQKCDGFFAASNITDHSLGAIDLLHQGEEGYENMWQKIRSMWAYAYDHYLEEYDFFHICGDDVYIAVENLRSFFDGPDVLRLENGYLDEISRHPDFIDKASKWTSSEYYKDVHGLSARPLLFGSPGRHRNIFPCGGPGYTMNRAALEFFGKVGLPSHLASYKDSREDIFMGDFFTQHGIIVSHVTDRFNGTRYGSTAFSSNKPFAEFIACPGTKSTMKRYGYGMVDNLEAVSEEMSAFHLKRWNEKKRGSVPELIYRYHAVLYDLC